jgi:hypothetical protein
VCAAFSIVNYYSTSGKARSKLQAAELAKKEFRPAKSKLPALGRLVWPSSQVVKGQWLLVFLLLQFCAIGLVTKVSFFFVERLSVARTVLRITNQAAIEAKQGRSCRR